LEKSVKNPGFVKKIVPAEQCNQEIHLTDKRAGQAVFLTLLKAG